MGERGDRERWRMGGGKGKKVFACVGACVLVHDKKCGPSTHKLYSSFLWDCCIVL